MQHSTSTPSPKPEPQKQSPNSVPVIGIARPKGMPFAEFKERCVQALVEKGIIRPEDAESCTPLEDRSSIEHRDPTLKKPVLKQIKQEMLDGIRGQSQPPPEKGNPSD